MRDYVELRDLYPLIKEVIEKGGEFRLFPRGTSMEPLLHQGEDSVMLGEAKDIKVGDVLFYRRENGAFVLHRLIDIRKGSYTMCGDNQKGLEYGLSPSLVLAKMTSYYTGDTHHTLDEPEYIAHTKKMLSRVPFYRKNPSLLKLLSKIKRIFVK